MTVVVRPHGLHQRARRAGLALRIEIALQSGEGALRGGEVSRLETLAEGVEIVHDRVGAGGRRLAGRLGGRSAVLGLRRQQFLQCRVGLLRSGKISGLQGTGKLLEVLLDLLGEREGLRLSQGGQ